tara:strand:+ start:60448 stop:61404 length:957 start_codon:yes stop_codon:yes gene_type:complete
MQAIECAIKDYFEGGLKLEVVGKPKLISDSNNDVYLVHTNAGLYTFKLLSDLDIDLEFVKRCNEFISHKISCQKILKVDELPHLLNGHPFVVSEYMQGRDLRDVIESGDITEDIEAKFLVLLEELLSAINEIPSLPKEGYGAYKTSRPLYKTFDGSINAAISIYAGKFSKAFGTSSKWGHFEKVLTSYCAMKSQEGNYSFAVVSFDMNLKNFIMDDSGNLNLLNLPILGFSICEAGVGEMTSQLIGSPLRAKLMDIYVKQGMDKGLIVFYETIALLGTLSAATGTDFSYIEDVECWGYKANVAQSIEENIAKLERISG